MHPHIFNPRFCHYTTWWSKWWGRWLSTSWGMPNQSSSIPLLTYIIRDLYPKQLTPFTKKLLIFQTADTMVRADRWYRGIPTGSIQIGGCEEHQCGSLRSGNMPGHSFLSMVEQQRSKISTSVWTPLVDILYSSFKSVHNLKRVSYSVLPCINFFSTANDTSII